MLRPNSQKLRNGEFDIEETIYKYLYKLPPKEGRYIVLDTETTGLGESAQMVELGANEIINGKITGNQFHIYIRPRIQMDKAVINIHKITNSFYDEYFSDVYESDKQNLINFCKFLGNSLIFAHNAPFDMDIINNELRYWGMNEIPIKRYRCSMRIFMDVIGKVDVKYSEKFTSLSNCCEFFNLKSPINNFHNGLFDSFMTSRMICKIYETLDNNPVLRKKLGYNQKSLDYFFIDNIVKKNKSKRLKSKNKNQNKNDNKKSSKKILNNMNYSKYIIDENNSNNKKIINNNKENKQNKEKDWMKKGIINYDNKFKNEESNTKLMLSFNKEKNKKKCKSANKQSINHLEKNINSKNYKSSLKDSSSKIISSKKKQTDGKINDSKEEKNNFDFENEEMPEESIDELFSELL